MGHGNLAGPGSLASLLVIFKPAASLSRVVPTLSLR